MQEPRLFQAGFLLPKAHVDIACAGLMGSTLSESAPQREGPAPCGAGPLPTIPGGHLGQWNLRTLNSACEANRRVWSFMQQYVGFGKSCSATNRLVFAQVVGSQCCWQSKVHQLFRCCPRRISPGRNVSLQSFTASIQFSVSTPIDQPNGE